MRLSPPPRRSFRSFLMLGTGLALAGGARAQSQTYLATGEPGGGSSTAACVGAAVDGAGTRLAFSSRSTAFTAGLTGTVERVFVHELPSGVFSLVSASSGGAIANADSRHPSISRTGRFVAFESSASNLVLFDVNITGPDVFLKDTLTGSIRLMSINQDGVQQQGTNQNASISALGTTVVFENSGEIFGSSGTRLIASHTISSQDVRCMSTGPGGVLANGDSFDPVVSEDGRYVAFWSIASNLVVGDTNGVADVFVRDIVGGTTTRVSVRPGGFQTSGFSSRPSISIDGRYVSFLSADTLLVPGDANGSNDAFVADRVLGLVQRVSTTTSGAEGHGHALAARLSGDGRWVAIVSAANDLEALDANPGADVFLKDRLAGDLYLSSVSTAGVAANADVLACATNFDGRVTAMVTIANTLDAGDGDLVDDVYVRDRGFASSTSVCSGDGSGAICPCFNFGAPGHGCENYALTGGALLVGEGTPSVVHDTLTVQLTGCPHDTTAVLFQTTGLIAGGFGIGFGDGVRCIDGAIIRVGRKVVTPAGAAVYGYGVAGDIPLATVGGIPTAGATRYYQVVHRIEGSFCFQQRVNWSNSIQVEWAP